MILVFIALILLWINNYVYNYTTGYRNTYFRLTYGLYFLIVILCSIKWKSIISFGSQSFSILFTVLASIIIKVKNLKSNLFKRILTIPHNIQKLIKQFKFPISFL